MRYELWLITGADKIALGFKTPMLAEDTLTTVTPETLNSKQKQPTEREAVNMEYDDGPT